MSMNDGGVSHVTASYHRLRHQHPAWRLLSARRAPLVLACLKTMFQQQAERVTFEDAVQLLAEILAEHANNPDYEIANDDYPRLARRELRQHIKSKLIVERDGELSATDSLQQVLRFVERMEDRLMSSTASRLAAVQHQIAEVAARLNPDPEARAARIRDKIAELEDQLGRVAAGEVEVLAGDAAAEAIQDVYALTMSLCDDFGRVEDSYRQADQDLRISIIRDQQHRGLVVDRLLEGHEELVETPEGKVFQAFYSQLNDSEELDRMSRDLASVLDADVVEVALSRRQQTDLRRIRSRLVVESSNVVRARARSERDVRNYLRTGLGVEHQRVSQLLDGLLERALDIDWSRQATRRSPAPLPAVGTSVSVPVPDRLRAKDISIVDIDEPDFRRQSIDFDDIDEELWRALDGLDRHALAAETIGVVVRRGEAMTLAELAAALPPTHDLETLTVWVEMASQIGAEPATGIEIFDIEASDGTLLRFRVPQIMFDPGSMAAHVWEL